MTQNESIDAPDAGAASLHAARILLVDDDAIMRELAAAKLVEAGYEVDAAAHGREAFARLVENGADLVISDLDMPEMDGFELTRKIRASAPHADIPIIVITASDHADAVDAAFAAGATSFLAKPINWTLFGQSVLFVLRASKDQRALKEARDQAEAGARFKDSLMSVMSHELRTPLNAIIGFGQLLAEQFERENDHLHKEYSEYIVDGGKRLLNSVSDMLLASDARSGPISINETDCTVGELVLLGRAAVEKTAALADADIRVVLEDKDQELCCDRALVSRAISKLLDNSLKFCPRGVRIMIAATRTKTGGLAIVVEDNGPGVPPEKLDSLVQPFSLSDMSLKRSKEGLGLGLPLVHAIAAAHRIRFRIESRPGKGARALLLFPPERVFSQDRREPRAAAGVA
ncbi:MAG: response regulator [Amphiplicatus sp.]